MKKKKQFSILTTGEPQLRESNLVETNVRGVLPEALPAKVKVVLADKTGLVSANAANKEKNSKISLQFRKRKWVAHKKQGDKESLWQRVLLSRVVKWSQFYDPLILNSQFFTLEGTFTPPRHATGHATRTANSEQIRLIAMRSHSFQASPTVF